MSAGATLVSARQCPGPAARDPGGGAGPYPAKDHRMPNTPPPARRPRTPLADADVTAAARNADRIRDLPAQRRPARPITFDSAL